MINLANKNRKKAYKITWFDGQTVLTIPFMNQGLYQQLQEVDFDEISNGDFTDMAMTMQRLTIELLSQNYEGYKLTAEDIDALTFEVCMEIFGDYMNYVTNQLNL